MQQLENHRLPVTALSVKKQTGKVRRLFWFTLNKIKIPLSMARANAAAIQNRPLHGIQMPRAVLEWSKREKGW